MDRIIVVIQNGKVDRVFSNLKSLEIDVIDTDVHDYDDEGSDYSAECEILWKEIKDKKLKDHIV